MPRLADTAPGTSLAWEASGDGVPFIALHGAYSARSEVSGFLEPLVAGHSLRRVYVDAFAWGDDTTAPDRDPDTVPLACPRLLDDWIDRASRRVDVEA